MIYRLWVLTLAIKLLVSVSFPFLADEAYYWVWSKHLSLSYFDHPPFIAWLLNLGSVFENFGHAVRWPVVILGHLSILVWVAIMKRWLNERDLLLFFLMLSLNVITGLGPAIATPDSPLMFFWPLAIYCLLCALETQKLSWYLAVGVVCGLGFCSKYHMALFLPIVLIWCTVEKKWPQVKIKYVPLTFATYFIFALPVFIWNYKNDFASFIFQLNHGFVQKSANEQWVLDYIGSQIGLIFPTIVILAVMTSLKFKSLGEKRWLVYFAWLTPFLFFISSLKGRVEPNWTGIAFPAIFALAILTQKYFWIKSTLWVWTIAIVLGFSQVYFKWLPVNPSGLKTHEYNAYDDFLSYPQKYRPLYASSYQMASMLYYKTKTPVFKLKGTHRSDHFDYLAESLPQSSFYVLFGVWNNVPEWMTGYKNPEQVLPDHQNLRLLRFEKQ